MEELHSCNFVRACCWWIKVAFFIADSEDFYYFQCKVNLVIQSVQTSFFKGYIILKLINVRWRIGLSDFFLRVLRCCILLCSKLAWAPCKTDFRTQKGELCLTSRLMHHNKVFLYYISIATKHTQPKSKSSFQKSKTHQNMHLLHGRLLQRRCLIIPK